MAHAMRNSASGGVVLCSSDFAQANTPHFHKGVLVPYEMGPPSMLLSQSDEAELSQGKPLMQVIVNPETSTRRLMMVRNIPAPSSVVLDRILDIDAYPRMVNGVDRTERYLSVDHKDGIQEVRAIYDIHALHMKFRYFMTHRYDSAQRCMTFRLDYDRRSDIDDSVGYWFVMPRDKASCRVYYSCDTKMRGWVPGPVYTLLGKTALRQATTWVNTEACAQWAAMQAEQGRMARMRGAADELSAKMRSAVRGMLENTPEEAHRGGWFQRRRAQAVRLVRPLWPLHGDAFHCKQTHFMSLGGTGGTLFREFHH